MHPSARLDPDFLQARLASVLALAIEHLPKLDSYAKFWTDDENGDVIRMEDKIVAETAILVLLASRVPGLKGRCAELLSTLMTRLETAADSDRVKSTVVRCPHTVAQLGLAQVVLQTLGRGNIELQALVRNLFASGLAETLERIPYRAMEVRWVESLGGASCLNVADLLPLHVLIKPVHPISMNRDTGYAITHGLMYATNFGAEAPHPSLSTDLVRARIDAGLAWVVSNEDLDLLIEFIIAATLLRTPWSPYVAFAWQLWNSVWDELDFLPSPSFDAAKFSTLKGIAAEAYAFRNVYHTSYVAGLLCSILLANQFDPSHEAWKRPALPSTSVAAACALAAKKGQRFAGRIASRTQGTPSPSCSQSPATDRLARVGDLLSAMMPKHLHWQKILPKLNGERTLLAQVLGDSAIIHAARQYDIPKLLTAMNATIDLDAQPSLTVMEGALFLARQQFEDGCIGVQFTVAESRHSLAAAEATSVVSNCLETYGEIFASVGATERVTGR